MKNPVKTFLIKLFLFTLPAQIVFAMYFFLDPFKVLYNYPSYFENGKANYVSLNRDYVSMETFLNNYPKYHYDSFIFGSSSSFFYNVTEWEKHIHSGAAFQFNAYQEPLWGIEKKIEFIHKKNLRIKNVLIVLDYFILQDTMKQTGHLLDKHPLLSGKDDFSFQFEFFRIFISTQFFLPYADLLMSKKVKPYMSASKLFDERIMGYDPQTNQMSYPGTEYLITHDRDGYYKPKESIFYKRDSVEKFYPVVITEKQKIELKHIKGIFNEDSTNYKIVVSPAYDQKKLNAADIEYLRQLFGKENIYDFSGINEITQDRYNYYETTHYRPHIGDRIMQEIYK